MSMFLRRPPTRIPTMFLRGLKSKFLLTVQWIQVSGMPLATLSVPPYASSDDAILHTNSCFYVITPLRPRNVELLNCFHNDSPSVEDLRALRGPSVGPSSD